MKQNFNQKILGSMEMFKALSATQQARAPNMAASAPISPVLTVPFSLDTWPHQNVLVDTLEEEHYSAGEDIVVQGDEVLAQTQRNAP